MSSLYYDLRFVSMEKFISSLMNQASHSLKDLLVFLPQSYEGLKASKS